jgi:hypothetical protein
MSDSAASLRNVGRELQRLSSAARVAARLRRLAAERRSRTAAA